ncbi:MAG TPA: DinB family protein [Longimicrobiaceae bacterium]|nr:DinB family protein [Longimicrobiaceae bacterium]
MADATPGPRQQFLDAFEREHQTTMKVLRAYPPDRMELQPHPRSSTARDLAWTFVMEQVLAEKALTTGFDWSKPPTGMPKAPQTLDEITAALEQSHQKIVQLVRDFPDEKFSDTVQFMVGPKTLGDVPIIAFLWFLLSDQIHHRGQLSVYLRMADGKVPSIYGPTADEPWF